MNEIKTIYGGLLEMSDVCVGVYDKEFESSVSFTTNEELVSAYCHYNEYFTNEILISAWVAVNTHQLVEVKDLFEDMESSLHHVGRTYDIQGLLNFLDDEEDQQSFMNMQYEYRLKYIADSLTSLLDSLYIEELKVININDGRDRLNEKRVEKLLYQIANLNKLPGYSREIIEESLDAVLADIKQNIMDYYDGQYDEDEPNIASFNTCELIEELLGVSVGNYTVIKE